MSDERPPLSASQLAAHLGDRLPSPEDLPPGGAALADAIRDLIAAAVVSDIDDADKLEVAAEARRLTDRLQARVREPVIALTRHPSGWVDNLTQAGSGWWNPQSLRMRFEPLALPDPDAEPVPVEVVATCTLTDAHGGPPARAHGGVVMTLLDEALGVAATAAGAAGLTAGLTVRFRAGTPLGVPLELRARYVRSDGRKRFAVGELFADGVLTAEAEGVFIAPR
ncbi:MAG: hypothetical protein KDB21_07635 [Acidimicrobiales bacterium]|nr:hypothetical protein [Acidimicrobiales bacterium]